MEEEEVEWERELADNIRTFCATSSGAIAIVVDGTDVRKQNGLVMISGNYDNMKGSTSTYIYDYTNGSVRKGPEMKVARFNHASVTLQTGDVAVFGGYSSKIDIRYLSHYEVFNVESNSFSKIGNMIEKRNRPAAVTLPTGVVLIIGGGNGYRWLNTCEFFNPADKKISRSKAKMRFGRAGHTASLLPNGKVIVCGGDLVTVVLQTTEIYDPPTDSFSPGPLMTVKRDRHTATTLLDGKILLAGGEDWRSSASSELYDPSTNSFTAGPQMVVARKCHFAALLPDGSVLIGGGETDESRRTEIYDPVTNSFIKGADILEGRYLTAASNF
jgi:hypothetical protein